MKLLFLIVISLLVISCSTLVGYPGYYSVSAYDSNGNSLDSGRRFTIDGSTIHTWINGTCHAHPGATLIIKNVKTGDELIEESPYQCRGKKSDIIYHEFVAPKSIDFGEHVYKLAYKGIEENRAFYEYTSNNEKLENWNKLITLFYRKEAKNNTPEEFIKERKNSFGSEGVVWGANGYTNTVFQPSSNHPYYETATSKSFHYKKCDGQVRFTYAKRYKENETKQIRMETKKAIDELRNSNWLPDCIEIQNKDL